MKNAHSTNRIDIKNWNPTSIYLNDLPLLTVPIVPLMARAGENEVTCIAGYMLDATVIISATKTVSIATAALYPRSSGQLISSAYVELPIIFITIYEKKSETTTNIADSAIKPITRDSLELPRIFLVFTERSFAGICAMKKFR